MRLSVVSALVIGVSLTQIAAAPLRVFVVTNSPEITQHLRLGHAAAYTNTATPIPAEPKLGRGQLVQPHHTRPCIVNRLRHKALEASNALRSMFGLPLIQIDRPLHHKYHNSTHNTHYSTTPTLVTFGNDGTKTHGGDHVHILPVGGPANSWHYRHRRPCANAPFLKRLHFALMSLGPWEGRAVAFVLGCGIGVLLRMMWVLIVISYRTIKGGKEEEEYTVLVEEYIDDDAESIVVHPPTYTYIDEKADAKGQVEIAN